MATPLKAKYYVTGDRTFYPIVLGLILKRGISFIMLLLCWPVLVPQMTGTLFDCPETVNMSLEH